jgi:hypothetical protein
MTRMALQSLAAMPRRWARHGGWVVVLAVALSGLPLIGSAPAASPGAAAAPSYHLEQEGSFSERRNANGGWDRTATEPSFQVVHALMAYQHLVDLLLVQKLETTAHSDAEGTDSKLEVSGWVTGKSRYDTKVWSFTVPDDEGRLSREWSLFEGIKYGCCGGEDVHDYFSLKTGKRAGTGTSDHPAAALLSIPNTAVWRLVAYQSDNAQRRPDMKPEIQNFLGVLTLGSVEGVQHRVAVLAAGVEAWTPRLTLRLAGHAEDSTNLDLWAADGKPAPSGIRGCWVRLVFEDTKEALVPITGDDFDLTQAKLPAGYRLQRLPEPGR